MLDQQGQLDNLAYSAWDLEVAFNVNEREAVTAPGNEFGIIEAELLPVPIFDQPVEHIEVVREVDDTGRIAVRKTNCNTARKRAAWWHKTIFKHWAMLRSQPGEVRHLGPAGNLAAKKRCELVRAAIERFVTLFAQGFDGLGRPHRPVRGVGQLVDYPPRRADRCKQTKPQAGVEIGDAFFGDCRHVRQRTAPFVGGGGERGALGGL